MSLANEYTSGVCNIGTEEKRLRRRAGYFGLIITIISIILFGVFKIDPIFSFIFIFPVYFSVIGFYQDKSNFCVYFGFSGLYDMEEETRDIKKIQDDIKKKADRKKALKMSLIALIVSGFLTYGMYTFLFIVY